MTKTKILNDIIASDLFTAEVKAYATAWLKDIKTLSAYTADCTALSGAVIPATFVNGVIWATAADVAKAMNVTTEKATDMCAILVADGKLSQSGETYSVVKENGYDAVTEALASVVVSAVYVNGITSATVAQIAATMHITEAKAQTLCDINVSKGVLVATDGAYRLA